MALSALLITHVAAGGVGLGSGFTSIFARKGSRTHAAAGLVFVFAMLVMSACGAVIGLFQHLELKAAQLMNIFNGVLTFYLVLSGWYAGRQLRQNRLAWLCGMLMLILPDAFAMLGYGVAALRLPGTAIDGYPAAMYFFFGSIALIGAAGDLRLLRRGTLSTAERLKRHLWRMCSGLLIASASFFLGQQKTFTPALRGLPVWYGPPLLVFGIMIFWLLRLRKGRVAIGLQVSSVSSRSKAVVVAPSIAAHAIPTPIDRGSANLHQSNQ